MLVLAALASLFSTMDWYVSGAKLRPFDALVLVMFLHLVLARGLDTRLPRGLVLCGFFFAVHAAGALMLGPGNLLREGIQVGIVFIFGAYVYNSLTAEQLYRLLPLVTAILLVVLLYNIFWHLDHGYYTGWKRLSEPKMAFLFLPVLLTYFALKHHEAPSRGTRIAALLFPVLLPILLLSGERKALLLYLMCCFVYLVKTKMLVRSTGTFAVFTAVFAAVALLPFLLQVPYVAKQVNSMLSPFSAAEIRIYSTTDYVSESMSNAQRVFATSVGLEMFSNSPWIGIGTNAYESIVAEQFAHLPTILLMGIHSEFLRTLVENGLLGFLAFVLPLVRTLHFAIFSGGSDLDKAEWYGCLLFLAAVLILLAMESSSTKLMVPYVMIAMLPDLARRLRLATSSKVASALAVKPTPVHSRSHQ